MNQSLAREERRHSDTQTRRKFDVGHRQTAENRRQHEANFGSQTRIVVRASYIRYDREGCCGCRDCCEQDHSADVNSKGASQRG